MSLKVALDLLKLATNTFKIENEKCHHSLTMHDEKTLALTLIMGSEFKTFLLDEVDLKKDPEAIVLEIEDFLGRKQCQPCQSQNK